MGRLALAPLLLAVALAAPASIASAAPKCFGKKATIVSSAPRIVGTKGHDVIVVRGGGRHVVDGLGGNDRICGGPGEDVLRGGRGVDRIKGGDGNDRIHGGKGPDVLHGGRGDDFVDGEQGSDRIDGGPGDDRLHGDKGNDRIWGGPGEDLIEGGPGDDPRLDGGPGRDRVFGGPGSDVLDGGPGDGDVVRGDAGNDRIDGGPGERDIASFASASRGGVVVDLAAGRAKGDGTDTLHGIEDVVGSPHPDRIVGDAAVNRLDGGVGDDDLDGGGGIGDASEAFGGPGSDECRHFAVTNSCGPEDGPPPGTAQAILNRGLDGSSLVIQGSSRDDSLRVALGPSGWIVSNGIPIAAGDGCVNPPENPNLAVCPGEPELELVVIAGGPGDDEIVVDPSVPSGVVVRANGGPGSDTLVGGAGNDVLEAGENYNRPTHGNDTLIGNGGSDVLYADAGADLLLGGPGNDLLVNSVAVCQGHRFDGGPGVDTVSYARSQDGVRVVLGGSGGPPGCGTPDQVPSSNESLEGSQGPDVLIGDNRRNSLMGHAGADILIGRGGADFIDAADGQRDRRIDCGGGRDIVMRDPFDPPGIRC